MSNKKSIILFTTSFPYGDGEQFLETEINYLCSAFETVFVFPLHKFDKIRSIPSNCKVVDLTVSFTVQNKIRKYFFTHFSIIFKILLKTIMTSVHRKKYVFGLKKYIIDLILEIGMAEKYHELLINYLAKTDLIYFYWFDKPVLQFSILKQKRKINHKLVVRAHGYDYDKQQGYFHKYREYEIAMVNKIFPVSNYGVNYFKNQYKSLAKNVDVSYLGTNFIADNPTNYSNVIHIVSCSAFRSLKRVHLIVEILKEIKEEVVWTHFGSGTLEKEVKLKAKELPSNITVHFKGMVDNSEVLKYYTEQHVDFFINVSEIEGVPVSIMEAISFGIPVIGCNVGGVSEIVNNKTGYLFNKDFNIKDVAEKIIEHHSKTFEQKIEFTKSVKSFWVENFNARKNYIDFIDNKLKNL